MADINKSIEEIIEDDAKRQLEKLKVKIFSKTASINTEIDEALKKAPSKSRFWLTHKSMIYTILFPSFLLTIYRHMKPCINKVAVKGRL